jgi:hypothetical protein
VRAKRDDKRRGQRFNEQALGDLRADQDEHAITAVLVIAVSPRDSRMAECFLHRTVQTITDSDLVAVRPMPGPEALNIDRNDGPVNSAVLVLHQALPRETETSSRQPTSLIAN